MFSAGIRNPQRSMLICVAVTLVAWGSVAWGVIEMNVAGRETAGSGLMIGLALLPAILAPFLIFNFWRGVRVIAAMRRGEWQIARWTVTAAELGEFAASEKAHNARGIESLNDWTPPREMPSSGIEVILDRKSVV